jgi:hypothetical protein
MAAGQREDRALIFLMIGCGFVFLSTIPRVVRLNELGEPGDYGAQIGAAVLAWLFVVPLALYVFAAFVRLIARVFGGKGTGYSARLSLFWALLAASPLWLIWGLLAGYLGQAVAGVQAFGALAFAVFVYIWVMGIIETEFGKGAQS